MEEPQVKTEGIIVGADQGKIDILTLSNGSTTIRIDRDGHSLGSIMQRLVRRRKGSKSFGRAQRQRKNFIHWSLNQLNLKPIKELRLEEIINIGYRRSKSRLMLHWTNTVIRDKTAALCRENGVRLQLQSSTYRSQRCSQCGLVRKANRVGKKYQCKLCGYRADADFNASRNLEISLPDIPFALRNLKLNRIGFYWKVNGFSDLNGEELTVPLSQNSINSKSN
jgi:transposase